MQMCQHLLPCAAKACALRPVFARAVGGCGQQMKAYVQEGAMNQMLVGGAQSEATRRSGEPEPAAHGTRKAGQPTEVELAHFS